MEKEIELEQEAIVVYSGGGAVNSVNGYTGDVVLTTSDLENTSDYQTGTEVESAISTAIAGKQDTLTAGNNITISNNTISATDTTYSAGTGLTLNGTQFSVDTSTIATQQDVSNEATARENADINLQGQIDAISSASDVTDIVGTYAALQAYDTTHLKDNDIIKVLQDESQDDETTYYRWSTSTQTFTLIGEEGPYYTKSQTDTLLQAKQDNLTAGSNITIGSDNTISATDTTYTAGTNVSISSGNVISATDTTYTAGTGLSLNGTQFSADTTVLATQTDLSGKQNTLTAGSNITISGDTISATDTTYSDFTGTDGTAAGTAGLVPAPATTDAGKYLKADGTWDTVQAGPTVVQTTGTSTTDVMSQNAVSSMVFADPGSALGSNQKIRIGEGATVSGNRGVAIGAYSSGSGYRSVALGDSASATGRSSVALAYSNANSKGEFAIGVSGTEGYNSSAYRLISGVYDGQSAHDAATKGQLDSIAIQNAGAPTTATVGTVGQLLEDTTNGKLYICTDATNPYVWEEVGAGGGGGITELTSADYNYPTDNPTSIALWLLDEGMYSVNGNDNTVNVKMNSGRTDLVFSGLYEISNYTESGQVRKQIEGFYNENGTLKARVEQVAANGTYVLGINLVAPNISQSTGTSTTNVMSQNAVTSMIFKDPATRSKVQIGSTTTSANGNSSVAIGEAASSPNAGEISIGAGSGAGKNGAISIGYHAAASAVGEMNIGTYDGVYGYNSSHYRLLSGLYEPQSAHDAATKGYVDPTTDSSAPTTATVGRLGQIYIDTTNADAYMCVAVDTVTPAYTWKQITA